MELKSDKPIGLTQWVYIRIKAGILNLDFAPGSQLQVDEFSGELEVSRTPVREALLRLQKDGLVDVVPRVGFFVTKFAARDLEELYELREILESRAVYDAVQSMTEMESMKITEIFASTQKAVDQEDTTGFLDAEITFHNFLTESSHNKRLVAMVESMRDLTYRWRILSLHSKEDIRASLMEHKKIADAVQHGDAVVASRLMGEHIQNAKNRIVRMIPKE
jgi:DNA-binding GntR family transcriptional regulator